jgi:hypothetical protein
MPKYKKVNEGVIDKFLDKIFNTAAKKMQSSAIKKLSKADPQFKKDYDVLLKARDKMEKNLKAKGLTSADVAAQWVAKRAAQRRRGEQVEEINITELSAVMKYISRNTHSYKDKETGKTKDVSFASILKNKEHQEYMKVKSMVDKVKEKEAQGKSSAETKAKDKTKTDREDKEKKTKDQKQKIAQKIKDKEDAEAEKGLDALGKFFERPK